MNKVQVVVHPKLLRVESNSAQDKLRAAVAGHFGGEE
jgi:hypothetical protein